LNQKIKVGAVSYLNTKPMLLGLAQSDVQAQIELSIDYPAKIAAALLQQDIQLGLVPVAVIPRMAHAQIVTDFCIGCNGAVASVCLFSEVPIHEVDTILLDYQSRTSVNLTKILLKEYWQIKPQLVNTQSDYRHLINHRTAALVIGDRAFEQRQKSAYTYDLGEAWHLHTGLPFVFAAWVANQPLPQQFLENFNIALLQGLQQIDLVVQQNPYDLFDLKTYYTQHISYQLDAEKQKGLALFHAKMLSID
jgi:chorismate dehydratase